VSPVRSDDNVLQFLSVLSMLSGKLFLEVLTSHTLVLFSFAENISELSDVRVESLLLLDS